MSDAWSVGLFDCCAAPGGVGLCCEVTFCDCIVFGNAVAKLPTKAVGTKPPFILSGGGCCAPCFTYYITADGGLNGGWYSYSTTACSGAMGGGLACVTILQVLSTIFLLMPFRRAVAPPGVKSDALLDFCTLFFCKKCALCQEVNEMMIQEQKDFSKTTTITVAPKQFAL